MQKNASKKSQIELQHVQLECNTLQLQECANRGAATQRNFSLGEKLRCCSVAGKSCLECAEKCAVPEAAEKRTLAGSQPATGAATKTCCRCKLTKPATEFHRDTSRADGLADRCKYCAAEYYRLNRERVLEQQALYREWNRGWKNPKNAARMRAARASKRKD